MKTEFTKEFMIQNTGCLVKEYTINGVSSVDTSILENVYNNSGFEFSDDTILSIDNILDMTISIRKKMWFFLEKCELSEIEINKLKQEMPPLVLSIFTNKYPGSEISDESATLASEEENYDAYHACRANIPDVAGDPCMYSAYACYYAEDKSYTANIINYLKDFVA